MLDDTDRRILRHYQHDPGLANGDLASLILFGGLLLGLAAFGVVS